MRISKLARTLAITTILSILTPNCSTSLASPPDLTPEETRKTIELLRSCDQAQTSCQSARKLDQVLLAKQDELLKLQSTRIVQLEDKQNSLGSNPLIWFVAGMLTAAMTVHLVK